MNLCWPGLANCIVPLDRYDPPMGPTVVAHCNTLTLPVLNYSQWSSVVSRVQCRNYSVSFGSIDCKCKNYSVDYRSTD